MTHEFEKVKELLPYLDIVELEDVVKLSQQWIEDQIEAMQRIRLYVVSPSPKMGWHAQQTTLDTAGRQYDTIEKGDCTE
jgi:hypothetical protein